MQKTKRHQIPRSRSRSKSKVTTQYLRIRDEVVTISADSSIISLVQQMKAQSQDLKTLSIEEMFKNQHIDSSIKNSILRDLNTVLDDIQKTRSNLINDTEKIREWNEKARQKSIETLERMVNEGLLIRSGVLAKQIGISSQALSQARKKQRMFSIDIKGSAYYPAFFGNPDYDRSQLEEVCKVLGDLPGTSKLQFMITPKESLHGLTPLQGLQKGRLAEVKIAAKGFVER